MEGLVFLRERIPAYADYGDEDARHLVDKQVRAYVGEALSGLRERLEKELAGAVAELLDRTLLMCEFSNQQLMRAGGYLHGFQRRVSHKNTVQQHFSTARLYVYRQVSCWIER